MSIRHRRQGGFSLVELMVALVAGLIVSGAVLAFTVSSVRANTEFTRGTRLMQELRNVNDHLVEELERAGYDESAMKYVASDNTTSFSPFAPIKLDPADDLGDEADAVEEANCVIYAYDREPGDPGEINDEGGEIRAMRRATASVNGTDVGVIEVAESSDGITPACDGEGPDYGSYPVECNADSGWCPLSDPRVLDISRFTIDADESQEIDRITKTVKGVTTVVTPALRIRRYEVTLQGALASDTQTTRSIRTRIKVRSDCIRNVVAECDAAPTP